MFFLDRFVRPSRTGAAERQGHTAGHHFLAALEVVWITETQLLALVVALMNQIAHWHGYSQNIHIVHRIHRVICTLQLQFYYY